MGDLIERDWVLKNMLFDVDKEVVRKAPKVDAVEVVRCKNCENYIPWLDGMICSRIGSYYGDTDPNDFCSKGVRNNAAD